MTPDKKDKNKKNKKIIPSIVYLNNQISEIDKYVMNTNMDTVDIKIFDNDIKRINESTSHNSYLCEICRVYINVEKLNR